MSHSLCETCQCMRAVVTPKGSRFLLCHLSTSNPNYAKYPPQPIVRCEGYQPSEAVQAKEKKIILFLCTGNYYRSRFAESLFNSVAEQMGLSWRASSRGLALERGMGNIGPMAVSAIDALKARGVCADADCARPPTQATADDLERADRVIALKQAEHLPLLRERFPTWADEIEFWHVDDAPEALAAIEQEIMSLVARLL